MPYLFQSFAFSQTEEEVPELLGEDLLEIPYLTQELKFFDPENTTAPLPQFPTIYIHLTDGKIDALMYIESGKKMTIQFEFFKEGNILKVYLYTWKNSKTST